jgi:hypothetical protein
LAEQNERIKKAKANPLIPHHKKPSVKQKSTPISQEKKQKLDPDKDALRKQIIAMLGLGDKYDGSFEDLRKLVKRKQEKLAEIKKKEQLDERANLKQTILFARNARTSPSPTTTGMKAASPTPMSLNPEATRPGAVPVAALKLDSSPRKAAAPTAPAAEASISPAVNAISSRRVSVNVLSFFADCEAEAMEEATVVVKQKEMQRKSTQNAVEAIRLKMEEDEAADEAREDREFFGDPDADDEQEQEQPPLVNLHSAPPPPPAETLVSPAKILTPPPSPKPFSVSSVSAKSETPPSSPAAAPPSSIERKMKNELPENIKKTEAEEAAGSERKNAEKAAANEKKEAEEASKNEKNEWLAGLRAKRLEAAVKKERGDCEGEKAASNRVLPPRSNQSPPRPKPSPQPSSATEAGAKVGGLGASIADEIAKKAGSLKSAPRSPPPPSFVDDIVQKSTALKKTSQTEEPKKPAASPPSFAEEIVRKAQALNGNPDRPIEPIKKDLSKKDSGEGLTGELHAKLKKRRESGIAKPPAPPRRSSSVTFEGLPSSPPERVAEVKIDRKEALANLKRQVKAQKRASLNQDMSGMFSAPQQNNSDQPRRVIKLT